MRSKRVSWAPSKLQCQAVVPESWPYGVPGQERCAGEGWGRVPGLMCFLPCAWQV